MNQPSAAIYIVHIRTVQVPYIGWILGSSIRVSNIFVPEIIYVVLWDYQNQKSDKGNLLVLMFALFIA
jgi:hypothetical protein